MFHDKREESGISNWRRKKQFSFRPKCDAREQKKARKCFYASFADSPRPVRFYLLHNFASEWGKYMQSTPHELWRKIFEPISPDFKSTQKLSFSQRNGELEIQINCSQNVIAVSCKMSSQVPKLQRKRSAISHLKK